LPPELDLEKTQAAAITAAGSDHTEKIEATGIAWGNGYVQTFSATWNDALKAWQWKFERTDGRAEDRIRSAPLLDAIRDYRKRSGTSGSTPIKPLNPHPQHKHHESEHR
jgi:hypothetical protein